MQVYLKSAESAESFVAKVTTFRDSETARKLLVAVLEVWEL